LLKKFQGVSLALNNSSAWMRWAMRRRSGSPKQDAEGWKTNPSLSEFEKTPRSEYMEEQVKAALQNVRPSLQADGGDVEFVSIDSEGTVSVKLTGACGHCPMSQMTLKMGIENYLKKEIPQVKAVVGV
jgi:Fe-S cluster biogenesis protein NfuA